MADYKFNRTVRLDYHEVLAWQTEMYVAVGMSPTDANTSAHHLVIADARGVYSHGIMRTPTYIEKMRLGGLNPTARPEIIRGKGPTIVVDGHNAMGQVAASFGTEKAIELAREFGSSTVSITGSNHLGTCAYYTEQAAAADMVGFCWTINANNIMAPWGGIDARLGNNPFGISAPCLTRPPVTLDMATSVVARGKIAMAMKTGTQIPSNWALDKFGNPTTDPEAAFHGTVQPSGEYKGYGLTFMNAIVSAILNGSAFGEDVGDFFENPTQVQNTGHLLQFIDISAIDDVTAFKQRMDNAVTYLKAANRREGVDEIFVPGEMEARSFARQTEQGIDYPLEVIQELAQLGTTLGVSTRPEWTAEVAVR
ncbi:Ldh family oxidoreductase [Paenarthrobacter sp. NPDC091711]|uniref:Ldh family oxidoreductase n=1 Tax=Paenarthrobacter sp. NPDC091711 TaxID=3364385 RepID=UPI0038150F4E